VASLAGPPIANDTIDLAGRWNIIGSLGTPVPTSLVTSTPPGLVTSNYFSYHGGYVLDDTLIPGKGYWVRLKASGKLLLASSAAVPKDQAPSADRSLLAEANTLTITNEEGASQVLYFGKEPSSPAPTGRFDLPPVPPPGIFDARFASNRLLELFPATLESAREFSLAIHSDDPVAIHWHINPLSGVKFSLKYIDGSGKTQSRSVKGEGMWKLTSVELSSIRLRVENNVLPSTFALRQNYPNPFNPTTTIGYDLASDEYVTLVVYDLLGSEVARLVDGRQEAGSYEVQFSSQNLASGLYVYRLIAGKFTGDHKMLIMK
jgi:hypothetical protein